MGTLVLTKEMARGLQLVRNSLGPIHFHGVFLSERVRSRSIHTKARENNHWLRVIWPIYLLIIVILEVHKFLAKYSERKNGKKELAVVVVATTKSGGGLHVHGGGRIVRYLRR